MEIIFYIISHGLLAGAAQGNSFAGSDLGIVGANVLESHCLLGAAVLAGYLEFLKEHVKEKLRTTPHYLNAVIVLCKIYMYLGNNTKAFKVCIWARVLRVTIHR